LKTASKLDKPRFAIIGLQKNPKKKNVIKDPSVFDHYKLTNIKVILNSVTYPYDNLNMDFTKKKIMQGYNYINISVYIVLRILLWKRRRQTDIKSS
jgi:hypothetical protein